jgi:hypothetical protein
VSEREAEKEGKYNNNSSSNGNSSIKCYYKNAKHTNITHRLLAAILFIFSFISSPLDIRSIVLDI